MPSTAALCCFVAGPGSYRRRLESLKVNVSKHTQLGKSPLKPGPLACTETKLDTTTAPSFSYELSRQSRFRQLLRNGSARQRHRRCATQTSTRVRVSKLPGSLAPRWRLNYLLLWSLWAFRKRFFRINKRKKLFLCEILLGISTE